ncbi:MAG: PepSY domain-containing protein [Sulfuricella denitrificans]|nr:PepSY domain-containing protein [Sulfuricella denitrificans]
MKPLFLIAALLLPTAAAAEPWQHPAQRQQAENGRSQARITMSDAMAMVQRTFGGRVIQAQPARVSGHEGYRIKILTARGEVRVVHVDGETGEIQ